MSKERRKFPRVSLEADVRVKISKDSLRLDGRIRDLSENGVFIVTEQTRPIGTGIELTLILTEGAMTAKTKGIIVHEVKKDEGTDEKPAGIGVMFLEISEEAVSSIRTLVSVGVPI